MTFNQLNKGVRTINKDTKTDILKWATAIVLATISIVAHLTVTNELEKLETEIVELTKQKEYLTQLKTHYEELIKLQDELEINLNFQIEILENNLTKLQEENEQLRTIRAKLTAYSPLDNRDGQQAQGNPTRTSIGRRVGRNIAAADPQKLPYGTKLEIPNWGIVEVGDTGGALRNDNKNIRIDLFHSTYKDAMQFGVKDTEVKILEWGDD